MKQTKTYLIVFLWTFIISFNSLGQSINQPFEYPHQLYTSKNGLSKSACSQVFEDSKGFIWITTNEGINRFDGYSFENYLTNSIFTDEAVFNIQEDKKGSIWFSGNSGIYEWNGDTVINHLPEMAKDITPYYFFVTDKGQIYFKDRSSKQEIYTIQNNEIIEVEFFVPKKEDQPIYFWNIISSDENSLILKANTQSEYFFAKINLKEKSELEIIKVGDKKKFNKIFLSTSLPTKYVRADNKIFHLIDNSFKFIRTVNELAYPFIVLNDEIYTIEGNILFLYTDGEVLNLGIKAIYASSIIVGKNGIIWISTGQGLLKIKPQFFQTYLNSKGVIPNVFSIVEDDLNNIWFASYGAGIQRMDRDGQLISIDEYKSFMRISPNNLYCGAISTKNHGLLFPNGGNIIKYDLGKFQELPSSKSKYAVQDILEDKDTLFLATKGLGKMTPNNQSIILSEEDGLDIQTLKFIEKIEQDSQNNLWLCSHTGLAKYNRDTFSNYSIGKDIKSGINTMTKDFRKNIWFGTHNGLMLYDYKDELPREVFPNRITGSIQSISSIDSSYLVLGTLNGLTLIDLDSFYQNKLVYWHLDEENGFDGTECSPNCNFVDSDGNVWIGTGTNVVKLIPDNLILETAPTPVILKSYSVTNPRSGDKITQKNISSNTSEILLKSNDNLKIDFYSINHLNPKKLKFQYWLKGYGNDWSPISKERFVSFSNLPEGKYGLEIRSFLNGKTSNPVSIPIVVKPSHILESKWVIPSLITFLALLFLFSLFQIIRRKKQKMEWTNKILSKEADLFKIKQQLTLIQTNPHFTFNILNSISGLIAQKELLQARRFIGMFGGLFRQMLINDEKLTRSLEEELNFVENYLKLEQLRFSDKFQYSIKIKKDVNLNSHVPKLIIQSFVNNAVKYAIEPMKHKGGMIKVEVSENNELIKIRIEDNGEGIFSFQNKTNSTGKGVNLVKNTIEWLNNQYPKPSSLEITEITNSNMEIEGTRIELSLYNKFKIH